MGRDYRRSFNAGLVLLASGTFGTCLIMSLNIPGDLSITVTRYLWYRELEVLLCPPRISHGRIHDRSTLLHSSISRNSRDLYNYPLLALLHRVL